MDLHICNKMEVVDIEKNSIACSCGSHKLLTYPIEDNCCKVCTISFERLEASP